MMSTTWWTLRQEVDRVEFDPRKHVMNLQGRDYLPVASRLSWFRAERPDWSIETSELYASEEQGIFRVECRILDEQGRILAMGRGRETVMGFPDGPYEKAETVAIGRALAALGYGTPEGDQRIPYDSGLASASEANPEKRAAYRRTIEGYWETRTGLDPDFRRAKRRWDSIRSCLGLERTSAPLRGIGLFFRTASVEQMEAYRRHISRQVRELQSTEES